MFTLTLLLAAAQAMAWEHEGTAWASVPVAVCIDDQGVDPTWVDDAAAAVDAWNLVVEPFGLQLFTVVAECSDAQVAIALTDASTISKVITTDGPAVEVGACSYLGTTAATITAGVGLATPHEEVGAEPCTGAVSLRRIVAHELGHVLGLAHSCEEGEVCNDPELREALMYWAAAPCETAYLPGPDDLAGVRALYETPVCDPSAGPGTEGETLDSGEPFDVTSASADRTAASGCGCTSAGVRLGTVVHLLVVALLLAVRRAWGPVDRQSAARRLHPRG